MSDKQLYQDLVAARALIATPQQWCQGSIDFIRPDGIVAFCSLGAIQETVNGADVLCATQRVLAIAAELAEAICPGTRAALIWSQKQVIVQFNDRVARDHAAVKAVWDRAIAAVKARLDEARLPQQVEAIKAEALAQARAEPAAPALRRENRPPEMAAGAIPASATG